MADDGLRTLKSATGRGTITITDCVGYLTLAFITIILMPQLNNIAASLAAGGASLSYSGARRLASQGRAAIGRSDHEKSRRRWEGSDGRAVTTAGSMFNVAAGSAGRTRDRFVTWRDSDVIKRDGESGRPAPPPSTPRQYEPKFSPRDTSARAIMWRAEQDRIEDQRYFGDK